MAPKHTFEGSGLKRLAAILDWNNEDHRRSVAASLVQGVYALEHERHGSQAHDPSTWWKSFGFQSHPTILKDKVGSFFGAVYEYNSTSITPNIPRYVIAFRGTIFSNIRDLELDLKVILNRLGSDSRIFKAVNTVLDIIFESGASNVWLAGHSLGAAIALFTGKQMMKMGCCCTPIETYLFNPPFVSTHVEDFFKINKKFKPVLHIARNVATAGVAWATNQHDSFSEYDSWTPHLFVNESDIICKGYIGYFERREIMVKIGAAPIGRLATKHTIRSSISLSHKRDSEPLHVLPSAYLTINKSPSLDFSDAHRLHQWLKWEDHYESKLHLFSHL